MNELTEHVNMLEFVSAIGGLSEIVVAILAIVAIVYILSHVDNED